MSSDAKLLNTMSATEDAGKNDGDLKTKSDGLPQNVIICLAVIVLIIIIYIIVHGVMGARVYEYEAVVGASIPNDSDGKLPIWKSIRVSTELQAIFILLGLIVASLVQCALVRLNSRYTKIIAPIMGLIAAGLVIYRCTDSAIQHLNVYFGFLGVFFFLSGLMAVYAAYMALNSTQEGFKFIGVAMIIFAILFTIMMTAAFNMSFNVRTGEEALTIITNLESIIDGQS